MKGFSHFVLEYTLELATDAMPPEENPRVASCIQVIRQYLDLSLAQWPDADYDKELRQPVIELMDIALQKRQFLIAARLQDIVRFLGDTTAKTDVA
jgi:hypothetical protein